MGVRATGMELAPVRKADRVEPLRFEGAQPGNPIRDEGNGS